jgi:hypothetical protein
LSWNKAIMKDDGRLYLDEGGEAVRGSARGRRQVRLDWHDAQGQGRQRDIRSGIEEWVGTRGSHVDDDNPRQRLAARHGHR